jgi:hypothetical protein
MKTVIFRADKSNTGKLISSSVDKTIEIKKGRYIHDEISHPLYSENEFYFKRIYCLEFKNKKIYYLNTFGKTDRDLGFHIALSKWQNHKFLWLQNRHWLQKEENIRYLVNLLFLVLGAYIAIRNMK